MKKMIYLFIGMCVCGLMIGAPPVPPQNSQTSKNVPAKSIGKIIENEFNEKHTVMVEESIFRQRLSPVDVSKHVGELDYILSAKSWDVIRMKTALAFRDPLLNSVFASDPLDTRVGELSIREIGIEKILGKLTSATHVEMHSTFHSHHLDGAAFFISSHNGTLRECLVQLTEQAAQGCLKLMYFYKEGDSSKYFIGISFNLLRSK